LFIRCRTTRFARAKAASGSPADFFHVLDVARGIVVDPGRVLLEGGNGIGDGGQGLPVHHDVGGRIHGQRF